MDRLVANRKANESTACKQVISVKPEDRLTTKAILRERRLPASILLLNVIRLATLVDPPCNLGATCDVAIRVAASIQVRGVEPQDKPIK